MNKLKKIIFPGFSDISFWDVSRMFFKGLSKGFLATRAQSISFSFFLAFFPAIIFIFTLIPYIPVPNFQFKLLTLINDVTPKDAYLVIQSTIEDIIKRPRGGLLSIGFGLTIYFAANGTNSIIQAFNDTYHTMENRKWHRQYGIALMLVFIFSSIIIIAITLLTLGTSFLHLLIVQGLLKKKITIVLLQFLKWIIIIAMFFFAISFLYYYAPAKQTRFKFISPGTILATFLFICTSLGFNFYISHFSRYNKIYGSIGTLLIIMLWIYFNSYILLLGFELNASIRNVVNKKE